MLAMFQGIDVLIVYFGIVHPFATGGADLQKNKVGKNKKR
jgi:hypothetical protein